MLTSESAITDTNIGQVFRKNEGNAEHGGEGLRDITVPGGVALRSQGRDMETVIPGSIVIHNLVSYSTKLLFSKHLLFCERVKSVYENMLL